MTRHFPMCSALAATALFGLACGAGQGAAAAASDARGTTSAETARELDGIESNGAPLAPVQAGRYRLTLSVSCDARDETETGSLTLAPISTAELGGDATSSERVLLWGQTDLELGSFSACLGPARPAGEPIHPGVLMEVLHWDGGGDRQVLLVSTQASPGEAVRSGSGIAMWVDRVDGAHIGGVWSPWELTGGGEGRWHAERVPGR